MAEQGDDLHLRLAEELADARRRIDAVADPTVRGQFARRLIAVTTAAKRDLPTARRRLGLLVAELDAVAGDGVERPTQ